MSFEKWSTEVLDEFDEWIHNEYEQSGDDETILHIIVKLNEIKDKYNVQTRK